MSVLITKINLTNKPFLCLDPADASIKAKRYANTSGVAWWFWESAGRHYCSEVPDRYLGSVGNVRSMQHCYEDGITKVIVPPNAP